MCEPIVMYSFQEIYKAYLECRKFKRNSPSAINFEINLIDNLWDIHDEINSFNYKPKTYIYFLTFSPKLREIFASNFRDRVVHHLLVKDLDAIFEPLFIYDSYSCRKNKGIHLAINRLAKFTQNKKYSYYLQLDIKSFFLTIHKNILFEQIREEVVKKDKIKLQRILYLCTKIIFDDPTQNYIFKGDNKKRYALPKHKSLFYAPKNKGLPIGNLTSQFFANVYMNRFDNFIKRKLKIKYYMRYVDDMVFLGETKEELTQLKIKVEHYLKDTLQLELRDAFFLKKTTQGIDFLGYIVRPTHVLVRQRVVNNFKYKKAQFLETKFRDDGTCSKEDGLRFKEINASFYGHIRHADSFSLMKKYKIKNWIKDKK